MWKRSVIYFVSLLLITIPMTATASSVRAPIICAKQAFAWLLDTKKAVTLCAGAESSAPIACAMESYAWLRNFDQAICLCVGAKNRAPLTCALEAYGWLLDKDLAIKLCAGAGEDDDEVVRWGS